MKTTLISSALYWATGNHVQFRIPGAAIRAICRSGPNYSATDAWLPEVQRLTEELYRDNPDNPWNPTPERIRKELQEYGAWDDEELADDSANWQRLLWAFAWNVFEEAVPDCSDPV